MASVLVITRMGDPTADLVIVELYRRGVPVVRFDLADFPECMVETARIDSDSREWAGELRTPHRVVSLAEISAVWYRKPTGFAVHERMTATEAKWAAAEAAAGFGGLLSALDVRWVNHPHANASADQRPRQLAVAAASGLTVPATLVTNSPERARDFCRDHAGTGVIYKPLTAGPRTENGEFVALYATTVRAEDITDDVARTAHLFQARVPCAYSVRVVAIDGRLFATRIDQPPDSTVDWRADHDRLSYRPITVPDAVAAGLRRMMAVLGLVYSSSDWIVTPDGEWTFLGDLNPNGQWAWLTPIQDEVTHALADCLTGEASS
ncbi:ATP-grasp ribosomal peptide maturase [Goodfellowiella coeruleoviolacea]|uniref:ATP-grasp ribosomal peptide maturase, SAV_5884 family n=1 Tax=Goodfellowiella coeruleoviolacea TaxID=334858 RepID=A0AAE3KGM2_9PSEU|nr:ATP-grasp ribosomal peptide maturase [Goodfellowiella coeruleoviolacea]MCP2165589.1 ATP-grasp ribosomal peptide maturase, SAV_5884 family [Goodfellowiella coeruleoviolacea]